MRGKMAEKKEEKKAKRPTALKRNLQSIKKQKSNKAFKSKVRTAVRTFKKAVEEKKNADAVQPELNLINKLLDKGVKKKIFKKNKAARIKSKLAMKATLEKK